MVCGPELEDIWAFIASYGPDVPRRELDRWFSQGGCTKVSTSGIDEALTVLRTLRLVTGRDALSAANTGLPFRLELLQQMRAFSLGRETGSHILDGWYLGLLDQLFIRPDTIYVGDLHRQANRLNPPLPINDEKLNAWRRVMEWLGVGRRFGTGFMARFSPELVESLLLTWERTTGPLEDFLMHAERFLPCTTMHTDLPQALQITLSWLQKGKRVDISFRQDAPFKSFGGGRRVNWIRVEGRATVDSVS